MASAYANISGICSPAAVRSVQVCIFPPLIPAFFLFQWRTDLSACCLASYLYGDGWAGFSFARSRRFCCCRCPDLRELLFFFFFPFLDFGICQLHRFGGLLLFSPSCYLTSLRSSCWLLSLRVRTSSARCFRLGGISIFQCFRCLSV